MNTATKRKIERSKEKPDSHNKRLLFEGSAVNSASRNNATAKHPKAEDSILNKSFGSGGKLT
ncbi:MAG: hypothetical protein FJ023_01040 [Chloroflexi bacterium]|nr:hypothetical protein [Chloroflexota bacterium]